MTSTPLNSPDEFPKRRKKITNPWYLLAVIAAALLSYYFNSHKYIGIYQDFEKPQEGVKRTSSLKIIPLPHPVGEENVTTDERHVVKKRFSKKHPKEETTKATPSMTKGKLAIVIDDLGTPQDMQELKKLSLTLNYAFFPYNPEMSTQSLSKSVSTPLIHLPLEALNYKDENPTLTIKSTQEEINQTIGSIRHDFPHISLINNHTGSRFTENCEAMVRLLIALDHFGFEFLDSKTSTRSCALKSAQGMGLKIWERDVFLDHDPDVTVIKKQILEAIACAKEKGSCIAIGHPRPTTLQALRELHTQLQEVTLVQLREIPHP